MEPVARQEQTGESEQSSEEHKTHDLSFSTNATNGEITGKGELTERQQMILKDLKAVLAAAQPDTALLATVLENCQDARKLFESGTKLVLPNPGAPTADVATRFQLSSTISNCLSRTITDLTVQVLETDISLARLANFTAGIAPREMAELLYKDPAGPVCAYLELSETLIGLREVLHEEALKIGTILANTTEYINFQEALRGQFAPGAGAGADREGDL
ncbi:hypothetical protein H2200_005847 [Cladophialophora chaetospira]|uniref:Uncharacterized protein n=1 Tax=Cladophialophora chaetospira TaxID=386627 RepID=A0AA38XAD6_9EURO|nr:hypothetical protein H2200_005847 [Cladophialophora chaetospira]